MGYGEPVEVCILEGCEQILAHASLLEELAEDCGQSGSMHWLGYFLTADAAGWKLPCMVLFVRQSAHGYLLQSGDVRAAALFYQFMPFGVRTGAFSTDDWQGRRTVTAPPALRGDVARMAVEALLERGAHVVLASYQGMHSDQPYADETRDDEMPQGSKVLWAERQRSLDHCQMPLGKTYAETLAKCGTPTRFNLRYYRRQLLKKMSYEFVSDVCKTMSEDECLALNANSLNPVSAKECRRRYRASRDLGGGFLTGLRQPGGSWLSILGGWRQGATTVVYYQMNAAGYEKDALARIMRSSFLENEVERGTQTVVFYHGTNHPMFHAFDTETVCDLIVRRQSVRARILSMLASLLSSPRNDREASYFAGSSSFLGDALTSDAMVWRSDFPAPLRPFAFRR